MNRFSFSRGAFYAFLLSLAAATAFAIATTLPQASPQGRVGSVAPSSRSRHSRR
ncbi:MAG: hypothetical protein P8Y42_16355 [Exilibacterium sp.]